MKKKRAKSNSLPTRVSPPRRRIPWDEYNPDPRDEKLLRAKMDELIDTHPGKYVVVIGGEVIVGKGKSVALRAQAARKRHPGITPTGSPIPRLQDLICLL